MNPIDGGKIVSPCMNADTQTTVVIIAQNRMGPYQAAEERRPKVSADQVPPFYRSSDMAWTMWLHQAGPIGQLKNLRFYFSLAIGNALTSRIMARALQEMGVTLKPYPGFRFWTNLPEGQALLGMVRTKKSEKRMLINMPATPNAVGMVYFLIEHKRELGRKFIEYVSLFQCDDINESLCAMFEISNNPSPSSENEDLADVSGNGTSSSGSG